MITVPAPLVIQGNNKQVCALEVLQSLLCVDRLLTGLLTSFLPGARCIAQEGIAKRPAQAIEDGCAQQKSLNVFGLLMQDFFNQIVQHEMVAASESLDKTGGVMMPPHGNRG